ncbi:arsenate reductase [Vibrio sp. UCD-FRSSP16_10]|uniref:ArsC family reductase n=1 Tax=unclassified Vibrio TaxID=2614977 RepID=UPI0007FD17AF|nr:MULTISPECIES: ArsC family reductase [unclassified Vibrio]OBT08631.1 arsenate reductase [Vibrio sp. UCD-FRSSP16_30]OBT18161.1 arsenate reductase [Vibrio sp. UCD-FRSSP16_10]
MSVIMYGIPNCDTIKKAKKWLQEHQIEFTFHDYRKQGITPELVGEFCDHFGWELVLNKRGTTYRQLSDEQKQSLNHDLAISLLVEQPAMIKRPIIRIGDMLHLGFKADQYHNIFHV